MYESTLKSILDDLDEKVNSLVAFLRSSIGEGDVNVHIVPVLLSAWGSHGTLYKAFRVTPPSLPSFLGEHPAMLPSPPTVRVMLGKEPSADLLVPLLDRVGRRI